MGKLRRAGLAVAALAVGAAVAAASCGQTPVEVAIHTFEAAQKVAVVCLNVGNPDAGAIPVRQENCAPVPLNVTGGSLPFHLIALVTQTTRGELAAVDVTAGYVIDEDKSTPGINLIPVGANPTDVVVSPGDGQYTYVSSAAPRQPAIYQIPNSRVLGDTTAVMSTPLLLTDLPACSLPQAPLVLKVESLPAGGDAGTQGDGGNDASSGNYVILALLGGPASPNPEMVAIDPTSSFRGTSGSLPPCTIKGMTTFSSDVPSSWEPGPVWPDGVPYVDGGVGDLPASEPRVAPTTICGETADGGTGVTAPDAGDNLGGIVPDGGFTVSLGSPTSPSPASMVMRDDMPIVYVADTALPIIHVIDVSKPTAPRELDPLLATSVTNPTEPVNLGKDLALSPPTRDYKRYLYAIDHSGGSLMVFDVTDLSSPHVPLQRPHAELNPLAPPDRLTFGAPVVTMAFVQHDWPLQIPGDTQHAYEGILCNPNPNAHRSANEFADLGAYYRVDQAGVIQTTGTATADNFPYRLRGVFAFATLSNGTMVAIDVDDWDAPCRRWDPMSAGSVTDTTVSKKTTYDGGLTGSLDIPEPIAGAEGSSSYLDPYHAPLTYQNAISESAAVTLEPFFPVSAPHRMRSSVLLTSSPGGRMPFVSKQPLLLDENGAPVTTTGSAGIHAPIMLPTVLSPDFIDPSQIQNPTEPNPAARVSLPTVLTFPDTTGASAADAGMTGTPVPGVRLSFDDPTATQTQDWAVTYEGVLPASNGIVATIGPTVTDPNSLNYYSTLTFSTMGANLCGIGIEDWSIGQARANQVLAELNNHYKPEPDGGLSPVLNLIDPNDGPNLPQWTADYIEITDDILPQGDPYWSVDASNNACWQIPGLKLDKDKSGDAGVQEEQQLANDRYNRCQTVFGSPGLDPDLSPARDVPILEAYQDHMVVGRFAFDGAQLEEATNRSIDRGSSNNANALKLMDCCFHHQAGFKVRAGGEWIAVGQNSIGLLHHVVAAQAPGSNQDGRCVLSCDPRDVLLNSRSFEVPWAAPTKPGSPTCVRQEPFPIDRDSALAMRNPMFSYVVWAGCGAPTDEDHTLSTRDLTWRFSTGNGFTPLTVPLGGTASNAVNPQSMLFIQPLGQLAVVDGAQQGLILIDLNTVAFSANYY